MNYSINCYLNNYGLCITKNKIDENLLNLIRNNLTVTPLAGMCNNSLQSYEIFYEDDKYIVLPKFLNNIKTIDGTFINFNINKYKFKHKKINIIFKGKLRDYQDNIINYVKIPGTLKE